jgi:hypothetical protein
MSPDRDEERERRIVWPDPAPDPEVEPDEDPDFHLLPNRERWRRLSTEERVELLELIDDWDGPLVQRWREAVAGL